MHVVVCLQALRGEGYPSWRAKDSAGLQAKFHRKGNPCLVSVRLSPRPLQSIDFNDISDELFTWTM